jgi:Na+-transporting methylmalonyl-CoA/oxaloacetate decarboxylase gamma subunit
MDADLINQGLTLMLAGMGTVFTFLSTLVIAMVLMSRTLMLLQGPGTDADATDEEVAAITAAIAKHRNAKKN